MKLSSPHTTHSLRFTSSLEFFVLGLALCLVMGSACREPKPVGPAGATPPAQTGRLPAAISNAESNAVLALVALDKKFAALQAEYDALKLSAAKASAQVGSANIANTNQPPSPATQVVDRETKLAMTNLPPQDVQEALEAAKRRMALLEGRTAEAEALYKTAQSEADRMKAEQTRLKAETEASRLEAESQRKKAEVAQAALVKAQADQAAELERNRTENQKKLDAAEKRAKEAEDKAAAEQHKFIFRTLLGVGISLFVAGVVMIALTNGTALVKGGLLSAGGAVAIGLAQVISNPWFDKVLTAAIVLGVFAFVGYLIWERKEATERKKVKEELQETQEASAFVIKAIDEEGLVVKDNAKTAFGRHLSSAMDRKHKQVIAKIRTDVVPTIKMS